MIFFLIYSIYTTFIFARLGYIIFFIIYFLNFVSKIYKDDICTQKKIIYQALMDFIKSIDSNEKNIDLEVPIDELLIRAQKLAITTVLC